VVDGLFLTNAVVSQSRCGVESVRCGVRSYQDDDLHYQDVDGQSHEEMYVEVEV
jgi:hypothetical protein